MVIGYHGDGISLEFRTTSLELHSVLSELPALHPILKDVHTELAHCASRIRELLPAPRTVAMEPAVD